MDVLPPAPGPTPLPDGVEAMNLLIKTIVLNNSRVRKLNAFRKIRRLDPREAEPVSDDEEESPVPTLGTFMRIQSALSRSSLPPAVQDSDPRSSPPRPRTSRLSAGPGILDDEAADAHDTAPAPPQ